MTPFQAHLPHLGGSEDRLWSLVAERCQPCVDARAIDQRIWDLYGETWAVMFTDLFGFSRSVEAFGIIHFLQAILEQKRILLPIVAAHEILLTSDAKVACGEVPEIEFENLGIAVGGSPENFRALYIQGA